MIGWDYSFTSSDDLQTAIADGTRTFERLVKHGRKLYDQLTDTDRHKRSVEVSVLNTNWIFRDSEGGEKKSLSYFIKALVETESELMYTTDFMITIIEEFWNLYQVSIFLTCLLPFLVYLYAAVRYFSYYLSNLEYEIEHPWKRISLQIVIIVLTVYFTFFEVRQARKSLIRYLLEFQNLVEYSSSAINVLLVILDCYIAPEDQAGHNDRLQILSSLAVLLMWVRLFFWMRLFKSTAFYARLLADTFKDVLPFMVLYFMVITLFANVFFILQEKRAFEGGERLYESKLGEEYEFEDSWLS